jgi:L-ascorbate metabolism protein UlaG (beta-lactamase superfamily)
MNLKFLGQAGFLIDLAGFRFLIDPYLSNYVITSGAGDAALFSREFPAPLEVQAIKNIDAIFITHDHADHCDPETILPLLDHNPGCMLIGPQPVLDHLEKEGVIQKNLCLAPVFTTKTIGSIRYTSVPSAHYGLDQDPISGEFPNLGFVLDLGGVILYHSGDTILYDGLEDCLKKISMHYDICCLPVNGRDTKREALGMIGNLHPEEALQLTDKLNAKWLIPMHNDLFKVNQLDPQRLNKYAKAHFPNQKIKWMKPGEEFLY